MERKYLYGVVVASAIAAGIAGRAWGQQQRPATKPADWSPSIARYYTGPVVSIGEFPGRLVRLSCDSNASTNTTAQSDERGRDYALIVHGDDAIHPLLPGTDEVRRELNSVGLQGRDVAVHGKYYPSTGMILVSRIVTVNPGAVHNDEASQEQTGGSTAGLTASRDRSPRSMCE